METMFYVLKVVFVLWSVFVIISATIKILTSEREAERMASTGILIFWYVLLLIFTIYQMFYA